MATVVSLTEAKIKELLAGWEGVALSQDQINSLIGQLLDSQDSVVSQMGDLQNVVIPQLHQDLAANSNRVSDLNDAVLPQLQLDLDSANATIADLTEVTVPAIQTDLLNNIENVETRPRIYVEDIAPEDPDADGRGLVVGDTWVDSTDNNKQHTWNGVEWSTFNVDIADFSLTVKKFLSTKHQIY